MKNKELSKFKKFSKFLLQKKKIFF